MNGPPPTPTGRYRFAPQQRLTVGDGFRVGFGIAVWMFVVSLMAWFFLVMVFGALAVVAGA